MKKLFMVLLAAFVLVGVYPTKSEAKVMYDGAEVVKGQTGKMTFKKDIKVYKKNPDGTFDSLVVKRNNFFRTYDIEKYEGKTFYHMGQYRVQETDLVVFKEVPIKIRSSFYDEPTYLVINRDRVYNYGYYGQYFDRWQGISFLDTNNGQILRSCESDGDEGAWCDEYSGTDIKIAELIRREKGVRYELTEDIEGQHSPLKGALRITMHEKGSVFISHGIEVNGHLFVSMDLGEIQTYAFWLPLNLLKPVKEK